MPFVFKLLPVYCARRNRQGIFELKVVGNEVKRKRWTVIFTLRLVANAA